MSSFKPDFSLLSHVHQEEALQFLFALCHKGGVICISEVIVNYEHNLTHLCPQFLRTYNGDDDHTYLKELSMRI